MKEFIIAIIIIFLVGIGFGCKTTKEQSTISAASITAPTIEMGYTLNFIANGHEPEWNVKVSYDKIIYKNINLKDSLLFVDVRENIIMDIAGIGYTGKNASGGTILVQVIKEKCNDTMEDKIYSYKVDVQITNDSELALKGCGEFRLDERMANKWYLESLNGNKVDEIFKDKRPYLTFDLDRKSVNANMGCNGIGGGYEVMANKIYFSPNFISTEMFCEGVMDLEKDFSVAITGKTLQYNLDNDKLMLYDMKHQLIMTLSSK